MSLRRYAPLAVGLALAACKNVHQQSPPATLTYAAFPAPGTPDASLAPPVPNDLVLQQAATVPGAQGQLLQSFVAAGGWPSDQEVPIVILIRTLHLDPTTGKYLPPGEPAQIDLSTVNDSTVAVVRIDQGQRQVLPIDTTATTYSIDTTAEVGTLTIHLQPAADGSRRWAAGGRYVVALRGWPDGIKTTSGASVGAAQPIALIAPNKNLAVPENQPTGGLSPAQVQQLEQLRGLYANPLTWCNNNGSWQFFPVPLPLTAPSTCAPIAPSIPDAFTAIDAVFPHAEAMTIQTFGIDADPTTHVLTDTGSGQLPLPSDFLLDPARPTTDGRFFVRNIPAFGAAAEGIMTLDGFSTTGLLLAPTTAPIDPLTVKKPNVLLFDVTNPTTPTLVCDVVDTVGGVSGCSKPVYVTQPPDLNRVVSGITVSPAIGLQPAVPVLLPNGQHLYLSPLNQRSRYVVVITNKVKDAARNALTRGTLAKLLFTLTDPLVVGGHSAISGVSDTDAEGLQAIRDGLTPLLDALPLLTGNAVSKADVVMAYPVSTQTVKDPSQALAAAPLRIEAGGQAAIFTPITAAPFTAPPAIPQTDVAGFFTASITTLDLINPATGAFYPDLTTRLSDPNTFKPVAQGGLIIQTPILVSVPKPADVSTACPPPNGALKCAPLVVFLHGINGGHLQALPMMNEFAKKGFVVASMDMPFHGDRSFCRENSDCVNGAVDGVCTPDQSRAGQGDAIPPGTCTTGTLKPDATGLRPVASGNYFVSANFFRVRDVLRSVVFDQSALLLALARPPSPWPAPAQNPLATAIVGTGVAVDITKVYFIGNSLGGIIGTSVLATNGRYPRGVLTVSGGTMFDVITRAPAFTADIDQLFSQPPISIDRSKIATDPVVAAKYAQLSILAKWILDPAEPINYAANVEQKLPMPLEPALATALAPLLTTTTDAQGQLAKCDTLVPNSTTFYDPPANTMPVGAFGELLFNDGSPSTIPFTLYSSASLPGGCVPHGMLIDLITSAPDAIEVQDQAAAFLGDLTRPPATFTLP